jgi:hypothetical protein
LIHLIKLCVGVSSFEELESYRNERQHWWDANYGNELHVHRTRMMPTRKIEIEGQGSIYWVIAGEVKCRQAIHSLVAATNSEGQACCDILMYPDLIRTAPYPKRPFQGWRYLKQEDAPPDMGMGEADDGSGIIAAELHRLGLL